MTEQEQGLKRELTARQMAMVAVGGSIGAGLLLLGSAQAHAGRSTSRGRSVHSRCADLLDGRDGAGRDVGSSSGGRILWCLCRALLNPWAGFIARYRYWFSVVIVVGLEVVAAATYMRQWYPPVPPLVWMVAFELFPFAINSSPWAITAPLNTGLPC